MEKIKITKKVFDAIEYVLNKEEWGYDKFSLYTRHCNTVDKKNNFISWDEENKFTNVLNTLGKRDMFKILCGDFEIELTPVEKIEAEIELVKKHLQDLEKMEETENIKKSKFINKGVIEGLYYSLNILNK